MTNLSFRPKRFVIMRLHKLTKQANVEKLIQACSNLQSNESMFN